jgi:branched-chain amino acid transport system permease protein
VSGHGFADTYAVLDRFFPIIIIASVPEFADAVASRMGSSEKVTTNLPGFLVSVLLIVTVLFVPNGTVEQHRARKAKKAALKK